MNIIKQLSNNNHRYHGLNGRKFITVHQTGNTSKGANAKMHANFIDNDSSETWHYTVDDHSIYQSLDDTVQGWHAHDGRHDGNLNSIGIELCINSDGNYTKTITNAVNLIKHLMKKHDISINRVVQHNHWSGKNCPAQIRAGVESITWSRFIGMVKTVDGNLTQVSKSIEQLAQEAIDGKLGTGEERKKQLGSKYHQVQTRVNELLNSPSKSIDQLAQEVIDGKLGAGDERRKRLGSKYHQVQTRVNELLKSPSKSIEQLAQEVIDGKHGTGDRRVKNLGRQYTAVQNKVNHMLHIDRLVTNTIKGKYGTGRTRRNNLGKDYNEVQKKVNEKLR